MSAEPQQKIVTRADMVAEADTWLDTPWVHQLSQKGSGADCVGFLRGMARFVGHAEAPFVAYQRVSDERQEEKGLLMIKLLDEELERLPSLFDAREGDWLAFKDKLSGLPQHVAMVRRYDAAAGIWQIIHATLKNGVRFNRLDRRELRFVIGAYHVPGVCDG